MLFDLRRALLGKEERESSRLMDFAFRQRARSFHLLADTLGLPGDALVRQIALAADEAILDRLVVERVSHAPNSANSMRAAAPRRGASWSRNSVTSRRTGWDSGGARSRPLFPYGWPIH